MSKFIYILLILLLCMPAQVFADLEITELMYDAEGSDTGYEWLEVYNQGNESIHVESWHFYENETHHGIIPDGFSILAPGEYALIVQDVSKIRSLYGNSLKLMKSSFSLNNTGETIALSDENKNIIGSKSYSVDDGASGNGMSLQIYQNNWIQAESTPGIVNTTEGETSSEPEDDEPSGNEQQIPKPEMQQENIDYYEGFLMFGEQRFAGSPVEIEVFVEHTRNNKTTKLKRGKYYINFGDGNSVEDTERFITEHIYEYPGIYEVTFEFYRNEPFAEEKPEVLIRRTLEIKSNSLQVDIDDQQGISIKNLTGGDIDLRGWHIQSLNQEYTFPNYSYLGKGKTITLSSRTHNLSMIYKGAPTILYNQDGKVIFSYPQDLQVDTQTKKGSSIVAKSSPNAAKVELLPSSHLEEFLIQHPDKHEVSFGSNEQLFDLEHKESEKETRTFPLWIIAGIGAVALLLAILRITSLSKKDEFPDRNNNIPSIELIE